MDGIGYASLCAHVKAHDTRRATAVQHGDNRGKSRACATSVASTPASGYPPMPGEWPYQILHWLPEFMAWQGRRKPGGSPQCKYSRCLVPDHTILSAGVIVKNHVFQPSEYIVPRKGPDGCRENAGSRLQDTVGLVGTGGLNLRSPAPHFVVQINLYLFFIVKLCFLRLYNNTFGHSETNQIDANNGNFQSIPKVPV
jgi:hypothetical protein